RTLTEDDARGACEMYPLGSPPVYQWTGAGGCSLSPNKSAETPLRSLVTTAFAAAALLLLTRLARRRSPAPATR
ncbi:MAG: hypothetical protein ABIS92_01390, partial [Polyangia bacterium]